MNKTVAYQDKPWLNHYAAHVPKKADYEEKFLPDCLDRSAAKYPDKDALIFQGYKMSFSQLKTMVDRFAACLLNFGVKRGDRVAILLPNTIPCVASFFSILKIGAVAVMNNPMYSDGELEYQFKNSGAVALITMDLLGNRMIDMRPKTDIKQIIYTSMGDYLPFPKKYLFPLVAQKKGFAADVKKAKDVYKWKKLMKQNTGKLSPVELSAEDLAIIQYTGGTTGVSKGAMLTHQNLSTQLQQLDTWFVDFNEGREITMCAPPYFHVFGITPGMSLSIYKAWTQILVPKPQPQFLLENIDKYKPSYVLLVPTMIINMLNDPGLDKIDMTCIKGCFSGSAPLPVDVINKFEEKTGAEVVEGLGMTEASPVCHVNPYKGKRKIGSVGLPIPNTYCRLVNLNDGTTDVPVGEPGEIIIKGPQVMKGYWKMPAETKGSLKDGWFHTGDIAVMDEEGYFFIVDRKKDMIISGGYNVYPRDIEEVFYGHPKVMEASAIGVPHPSRGEQVKLFLVLNDGASATPEEMVKYCEDKLAKYKWPTQIEFRNELPKSTVGKVLKKELRSAPSDSIASRNKEQK